MRSLVEAEIRSSFVNCTKGEAVRLPLPRDLGDRAWADLDFLAWRDGSAPDRAYLVTAHPESDVDLVGVTLRLAAQQRGLLHRSMCSLCLTTHPGNGVSLMTARKAGALGRQGNSVGVYICTDLACSLYVRGLKKPHTGGRLDETLSVDEQVERLRGKLDGFLAKILT
ncbi:MAG: FBP domain-containing protein [Hamadaea sp.]|uniref:FBP domain-containing protein n=1 Tax=Hamadaea sp. TaxID=2024425 RepID=UPI001819CBDA|nr:FBP domain-containing protein [Hamadaea sp.]NUR71546.1 FBP domain-containing protein [Hamadaea sp.]NUT19654.1 FBP domain-containing protein [Hamadaea sp.]